MLVKRQGGRLRRRPVVIGSGSAKPAAVLAALILSTLILSALVPLSALWPAAAVAQTVAQKYWNRLDDPLTAALGVHVGKTGGTGLAFKFPIQWWLYVQAAGMVWNTSDNKRHNIGFELQYLLRQDQKTRLFLAAAAANYYHSKREPVAGNEDNWVTEENWNYGFGVGGEWLIGKRWSLQAEIQFTHDGEDDNFILLPQAGAFYYW